VAQEIKALENNDTWSLVPFVGRQTLHMVQIGF